MAQVDSCPIKSKNQLLQQISKLSTFSKYKLNIQKSIVFLNSSNKKLESKTLNYNSIYNAKTRNILEINLTKDCLELYT